MSDPVPCSGAVRRAALVMVVTIVALSEALPLPATTRKQAVNLLVNPGFEDQGLPGLPEGWTPVVLDGGPDAPVHIWSDRASTGVASVAISSSGSSRGLWQQVVEVERGTVYTLSGQVAWQDVVPPGNCHLQVVFRSSDGEILQFVDLAGHDGSRDFELDFPYAMKFRAPADAALAEVNGFLQVADSSGGEFTMNFVDADLREVIRSIPGASLLEMAHSRENCLCCGGGGNLEMIDSGLSANIAKAKIDEVLRSGAEAVVTACQKCVRTMATYTRRNKISLEVMDIVQLIQRSLKG